MVEEIFFKSAQAIVADVSSTRILDCKSSKLLRICDYKWILEF
jgi:hypothetical protein